MKKWSRRKFLEAGVLGSMAVGGAKAAPGLAQSSKPNQGNSKGQEKGTSVLGANQWDALRAAMDEIIPAGDGMPAASEVGCVEYLKQLSGRDAKVAKELSESLRALDGLSQKRNATPFLTLSSENKVKNLSALQHEDADSFKVLRDYVYEAYYTRPAVWKLIGYEFYPTNASGPKMKPFDESILAEVRKKPKFYREVPG